MSVDTDEVKKELAYLLAKVKAMENDEAVDMFVFDRALLPSLRASEVIEVKIRRTHGKPITKPFYDVSVGVLENVPT